MTKGNFIFIAIWSILAICAFVSNFWAPLVLEIFNITFGGVNMLLIITWVLSWIKIRNNKKYLEEVIEKYNQELDEELNKEEVVEEPKPKKRGKNSKGR
jgi:hypothetical protein